MPWRVGLPPPPVQEPARLSTCPGALPCARDTPLSNCTSPVTPTLLKAPMTGASQSTMRTHRNHLLAGGCGTNQKTVTEKRILESVCYFTASNLPSFQNPEKDTCHAFLATDGFNATASFKHRITRLVLRLGSPGPGSHPPRTSSWDIHFLVYKEQ